MGIKVEFGKFDAAPHGENTDLEIKMNNKCVGVIERHHGVTANWRRELIYQRKPVTHYRVEFWGDEESEKDRDFDVSEFELPRKALKAAKDYAKEVLKQLEGNNG